MSYFHTDSSQLLKKVHPVTIFHHIKASDYPFKKTFTLRKNSSLNGYADYFCNPNNWADGSVTIDNGGYNLNEDKNKEKNFVVRFDCANNPFVGGPITGQWTYVELPNNLRKFGYFSLPHNSITITIDKGLITGLFFHV